MEHWLMSRRPGRAGSEELEEAGMTVTVGELAAFKARREPFIMLTCYDALTASALDEAGVPLLLVGDTLAMVVLGYDSTLPVGMDEMLVFTAAVARGARNAMVVGDMPFGSYQASAAEAMRNATRFLKAGANAVKLEGGARVTKAIGKMTRAGIPVMGHVGLTPQSVNALGGFKVQGRGQTGDQVLEDALALQDAGCFAVVLEAVPSELAARVTRALAIPTIGIGAGPEVDGQVLVTPDLIGLTSGPLPRFVKRYADTRATLVEAARHFAKDVAGGHYPGPEHQYH
jgi:3-methyl-2-oxobutanoate hydroxymethyltransferase